MLVCVLDGDCGAGLDRKYGADLPPTMESGAAEHQPLVQRHTSTVIGGVWSRKSARFCQWVCTGVLRLVANFGPEIAAGGCVRCLSLLQLRRTCDRQSPRPHVHPVALTNRGHIKTARTNYGNLSLINHG